jgi:hypothetical protein
MAQGFAIAADRGISAIEGRRVMSEWPRRGRGVRASPQAPDAKNAGALNGS